MSKKYFSLPFLPSDSLVSVMDPLKAFWADMALFKGTELQRNKDTIRCVVLSEEVPGHREEQWTQTLIALVFVVPNIGWSEPPLVTPDVTVWFNSTFNSYFSLPVLSGTWNPGASPAASASSTAETRKWETNPSRQDRSSFFHHYSNNLPAPSQTFSEPFTRYL